MNEYQQITNINTYQQISPNMNKHQQITSMNNIDKS